MAFRFSLESILRYRQSIERAEEIALQKIVQEISGVQLELVRLNAQQQTLREQRERELARSVPAIHIQEIAEQEMGLVLASETLQLKLRDLESMRLEQLAIYQAALQGRKVLSEIRAQKQHTYQREQLKQEQKMLDDTFLARPKDSD